MGMGSPMGKRFTISMVATMCLVSTIAIEPTLANCSMSKRAETDY